MAAFMRSKLVPTVAAFCSVWATAQVPVDLLPDIITNPALLMDTEIVKNVQPGRIHLLLANATPNIGDGPLEVFGVEPKHGVKGETQSVMQRIYRSDDSFYDREAGFFEYHPTHHHTHLQDWARYRLREILPNDQVGEVVAQGDKTSFCLLDSRAYDKNLPGAPSFPVYKNCDQGIQGISVGYEDLYGKDLPDQWIDITDVPDGEYWLESKADAGNVILEKDETNNVARVKVTIEKGDAGPNPLGILAALLAILQQLLALLRGFFA
jgi:hypothetical protein